MQYQLHFGPVFDNFGHLLAGAETTIRLSIGAMVLGLIVGLVCACGKTTGNRLVVAIVDVYIEVIRNTPFLAQIYVIYFALPEFGVRLSPNVAALTALVVNVGAFAAEIIRAGIESIAKGQVEAGIALGLKRLQVFRYVVLRPALRTIYPALTSQFIYLMLMTSVVSAISATDLSAAGNDIQQKTFTAFEVYLVVTGIYLLMSLGFSGFFRLVQRLAFNYPLSR